jgi:hypothetical protein
MEMSREVIRVPRWLINGNGAGLSAGLVLADAFAGRFHLDLEGHNTVPVTLSSGLGVAPRYAGKSPLAASKLPQ